MLITPPPFCSRYKLLVTKKSWGAALAAFFAGLAAMPAGAHSEDSSEAIVAAERLLGSADDQARMQELLPFTRTFGVSGTIEDSLAESALAAGVPASTMVEVLRALDAASDAKPRDGDTFYIRWQQTFTVEGHPIGVGRVLWLEVTGAESTTALHRFRPAEGGEQFFLSSGLVALPPALALPIDEPTISSRFGLRTDPVARARRGAAVGGPLPRSQRKGTHAKTHAHKGHGAPRPFVSLPIRTYMHEGVDFAVPRGTPIYAPADGVVGKAGPNGGYGIYLRVDHGDGLATAYGHLSRFAPGLTEGKRVSRGDLLGFSGNTGRSTGPHLHFEVLTDGRPVDPLLHAAVVQLAGPDYERFAREMAARERERASEIQQ